MNENATPTVKSLEERGNHYLSNGEFRKAQEYFNKALDIDITRSSCHWGLLLCEHQCTDETELVKEYALCFEENINYKGAWRYADEKQRRNYKAYLQMAALSCHSKVLLAFAERDFTVMNRRIDIYSSFSCASSKIERVHDYFYKYADNDTSVGPLLKSCLFLYEAYSEIEFDFESGLEYLGNNIIKEAQDTISECAKIYAEIYLDTILGADDSYDIKGAAQEFCDPKKTDTRGFDFSCSTPEGIDGYGNSPAERYSYLAERIYDSYDELSIKGIQRVVHCYKMAQETARNEDERSAALEAGRKFCIKATAYDKIKDYRRAEKLLDTLIGVYPAVPELYFNFVLLRTRKLTVMPGDFAESEGCRAYLEKSFKAFDKAELDSVYDELEKYKAQLEQEHEDYCKELEEYAVKAINLAGDSQSENYYSKWKDYEKLFTEKYNENHALVCAKLDEVTGKKHSDKQKGEKSTAKKSTALIITSVLLTLISAIVPLAVAAVVFIKPRMLLQYPSIALFGGAAGVGAVIGIISRLIIGSFSKKPAGPFERKKLHAVLLKAAPHLSSVFMLAVLGVLAYSFIAFPTQLGTVKIKNAKQLDYLLNCPTASFVLTEDITVKENQRISLQVFGGKLDGKGHTVKGLNQENYFIYSNTGTVKNIKFKNYTGKGFCYENTGEISDVTFNNAEFTASVVGKNTKSVKKLTFNSCKFAFSAKTFYNQAVVGSGATDKQLGTFNLNNCKYYNVPVFVNVEEGLNFRQEPSVWSYSYGVMLKGTELILREITDGWYCCERNGVTGWCAAEYISFEQ